MNVIAPSLAELVRAAVDSVDDPEYPGVSVVALGLLEGIRVHGNAVEVELIPTYGGCPALSFIANDVRSAVLAIDGIQTCEVRWLRSPVWSRDRVAPEAVHALETDFTVTLRRKDGTLRCPVCGADARDTAPMGPSRCRSLAYCDSCRNPIEVMR